MATPRPEQGPGLSSDQCSERGCLALSKSSLVWLQNVVEAYTAVKRKGIFLHGPRKRAEHSTLCSIFLLTPSGCRHSGCSWPPCRVSEFRGALPLPRFLVFLRYQVYYEYPLLTYLEYPILIAQEHSVRFVTSWFLLTLQKWIIDLAMNLCTFISAASKFAQLQCLWKTRDSGAVSALTWGLASSTSATRIITTLMTTNDLTILIRFVVTLALNLWVTATVLRYRKTGVKAE
ncbi:PQ-loop repeat-containing protein 3 [Myotis lucifugus]|uniref:PQ-loop repeat-containing protein 3 n=1 Tax=Myotis lucifugus TaxID=59463 RepID=UPI000CCC8F69|nr:PQ-loop repeat-containing protein 3 [Myotis lucifugus]